MIPVLACTTGECGQVAVGPGDAVAGAAGVDDHRVDLAQNFVAEADFVHRAGLEIFHYEVGLAHEALEDFLALGVFQIERDGAFVRVHQRERNAERLAFAAVERAHAVADPRHFDLDHLGAEVTQKHRGIGAVVVMGEVEDADIIEGERRGVGHIKTSALRSWSMRSRV
jgi:hypothetical protein